MAPSDTPLHLSTAIEPGELNEKIVPLQGVTVADDDEVEDMDALIDELESQDGHEEDVVAEGEVAAPGAVRVVPEELLQTDTRLGLTEAEVHARRKKFGMNQMKEEKENLILKFLGYFIGPIQFVMEVSVACVVIFSVLYRSGLPNIVLLSFHLILSRVAHFVSGLPANTIAS
jgi:H+-transporting ATPase